MDLNTFKEVLDFYFDLTHDDFALAIGNIELSDTTEAEFSITGYDDILEDIGKVMIVVKNTKLARKLYPNHKISNNNDYIYCARNLTAG